MATRSQLSADEAVSLLFSGDLLDLEDSESDTELPEDIEDVLDDQLQGCGSNLESSGSDSESDLTVVSDTSTNLGISSPTPTTSHFSHIRPR